MAQHITNKAIHNIGVECCWYNPGSTSLSCKVASAKLTPFQEKATQFKLVKKKTRSNRKQSEFWQFYHVYESLDNCPGQLTDRDNDYACCNLCGRDILYKGGTGTGGIRNHIMGLHPEMLTFVSTYLLLLAVVLIILRVARSGRQLQT
jgi:hypothetical protein